MGFVDYFNHAWIDVVEVMQLLITYLALHRVMPILPTVKAADIIFELCLQKKKITYVL